MPIVYEASTLQMEWCLGCHRAPEKFVRPKEKVFDMQWRAENKSKAEITEGQAWAKLYHVSHRSNNELFDCHR